MPLIQRLSKVDRSHTLPDHQSDGFRAGELPKAIARSHYLKAEVLPPPRLRSNLVQPPELLAGLAISKMIDYPPSNACPILWIKKKASFCKTEVEFTERR